MKVKRIKLVKDTGKENVPTLMDHIMMEIGNTTRDMDKGNIDMLMVHSSKDCGKTMSVMVSVLFIYQVAML